MCLVDMYVVQSSLTNEIAGVHPIWTNPKTTPKWTTPIWTNIIWTTPIYGPSKWG